MFRGRILKNEIGFVGLTELMIIIGIIGILTAMANPAYRFLRQRAREAVAIQDMGNILRPAIEQYRLVTGEFPTQAYRYALITSTLGSPYSAGTAVYSKWVGGLPYLSADMGPPPNPDNDVWFEDPWGNPYEIYTSGSTSCFIVSRGAINYKNNGAGTAYDSTSLTTTLKDSTKYNPNSGRIKDGNVDDMAVVIQLD